MRENPTDTTSAQGTYEFTSNKSVGTLRRPRSYLSSPIDNLQSFYYTTQWAAAFNDGAGGGTTGSRFKSFRR